MKTPPSSPLATQPESLLVRLLDVLQTSGSLLISFDDLSGFTMDYPELALPKVRQTHVCSFCMLAKNAGDLTSRGIGNCAKNKHAVSGLVLRRRDGFFGLCHLGLLDLVEPLIYHGVILGVFYYGSVSVRQWKTRSVHKIRRHCQRWNLDAAPFLDAFKEVPAIDASEIEMYRNRLKTVAESVVLFCEALAVPVDRYSVRPEAFAWRFLAKTPPLVRSVGEYISKHYDEPCRTSDLAHRFQCHPNYLGTLFKKSVGQSLSEFVNRLRVERARHLLHAGRFSAGEIGYRCGFGDPSHFSKVFRLYVGKTPQAYRESLELTKMTFERD